MQRNVASSHAPSFHPPFSFLSLTIVMNVLFPATSIGRKCCLNMPGIPTTPISYPTMDNYNGYCMDIACMGSPTRPLFMSCVYTSHRESYRPCSTYRHHSEWRVSPRSRRGESKLLCSPRPGFARASIYTITTTESTGTTSRTLVLWTHWLRQIKACLQHGPQPRRPPFRQRILQKSLHQMVVWIRWHPTSRH